jgi:hypothetical protein
VVENSDRGAAQPRDVFLSHVSARAIEAVCLLMADSLDLETLMAISHADTSSACTVVPFATRARMNEALCFPIENGEDGISSALPN